LPTDTGSVDATLTVWKRAEHFSTSLAAYPTSRPVRDWQGGSRLPP